MSQTEPTEIVTLSEAKAHLRISHNAEDALIGSMIVAGREYVETATGRQWRDPTAPGAVRARLIVLMLVGLWYANRSPVSVDRRGVAEVPMSVGRLVNQLKDWRLPATLEREEADSVGNRPGVSR